MMLTLEGARFRLVFELAFRNATREWWDHLIVLEEVIERPWGWVFRTTTRAIERGGYREVRYVEPHVYSVDRETGRVLPFRHTMGRTIEDCIATQERWCEQAAAGHELWIDEPQFCSPEVSRRLRSALGLSIAELKDLRSRLPCVYRTGAFYTLKPLRRRLIAEGVRAEIRPVARSGQGASDDV